MDAVACRMDVFGTPTSCGSDTCLAEVNRFIKCVLRYGTDWEAGRRAAEADSQCILAHVLHADFLIASLDMEGAGQALDKASALTSSAAHEGAAERDRSYLGAWKAWVAGDLGGAYDILVQFARQQPTDLFALKRAQLFAFLAGDAAGVLGAVDSPAVVRANQDRPYFHGMRCGRLADAEEEAARGDRIDGSDAWAHHCMAHTLYFQVRLRECEEYMLARAHAWTDICSFMYTHNWWHVALAQVEQDRLKDAHATFSRHVWGVNKDDSEDQFGACSMLWRFSLHQFAATGASALQRGLSPADALAEAGRGRAASEQEDSALIQDAAAHVRSSGVSRKRLVPLLDATILWALLAAGEGREAGAVLQDRLAMAQDATGPRGDRLRTHAAPLLRAIALHAAATRGSPQSNSGDGDSGVDWTAIVRCATEGACAADVTAAADQWGAGNAAPLLASAARICNDALRDVEGAAVLSGSVEQRDVVFLFCAVLQVEAGAADAALRMLRRRDKERPGVLTAQYLLRVAESLDE